MKIGVRLGIGFGLVLFLLAAVAGLGINGMSDSNDMLHKIVDVNVARMDLLNEMSESTHTTSETIRTVVLLSDESAINGELKKVEHAAKQYDDAMRTLSGMPLDDQDKALLKKIGDAGGIARPIDDQVIALAKANKDEEATQLLMKQAVPATSAWQDVLQEFVDLQKTRNQAAKSESIQSYQSALGLTLVLTALAILFGGVIAWFSTRSITRPISDAVRVARTVAAGDLTSQIEVRSTDETGQLLQALKDMNDALLRIVSQVRLGTDTIATASGQIASGNLDLSSRTEHQASSLEETASSMEELTATVRQNADNARQANQLSASASDVAVRGGTVVAQVVQTMGAINASSRKIVDIIAVIDGIAFQTNILALNAAVEAARAGEQGRGFAVVASEVRNLAQRSATAAKEIKDLISDSVEKVQTGASLVDQAGLTMDEIVASVKHVTDIMAEITAASSEQTAGIEQINQAVSQMDEVTQQNAALVEEAAAAASSLMDQASNLAGVVSVFKIDAVPEAVAGQVSSKTFGKPVKPLRSQPLLG